MVIKYCQMPLYVKISTQVPPQYDKIIFQYLVTLEFLSQFILFTVHYFHCNWILFANILFKIHSLVR